ncbi:9677_t:CDS:2, partial [Funneliformis geosporum]
DRLGLGVIDNKYDVAISTACPALNNIVVDSIELGQTCVEHLRKSNLVTLDGELIDKSCTMSGGSTQFELSKLEMYADACVKVLPIMKENSRVTMIPGVWDNFEHKLIILHELDRLKRQPSKIEEEIKILQDKILEIGSDKLRAQKFLAKNERELKIENFTKDIQQKAIVARSICIKADEAKSWLFLDDCSWENAELECCDSMDPFSEGVILCYAAEKELEKYFEFIWWRKVFALHHFKSTLINVMDEIDAAWIS